MPDKDKDAEAEVPSVIINDSDFKGYKFYLLKTLDRNDTEHATIINRVVASEEKFATKLDSEIGRIHKRLDGTDEKLVQILTKLGVKDNRYKLYIALIGTVAGVIASLLTTLLAA